MKHFFFILFFVFILFGIACSPKLNPISIPKSTLYVEAIQQWQTNRANGLTTKDGWLSLAGLFWLKDGINNFGSASENNLVFPEKTPNYIGNFNLENGKVNMHIKEKVPVMANSALVKNIELIPDKLGNPTLVSLENWSWYLLKRENRFGIRLKNAQNKAIQNFEGLHYFPINKDWQLLAKLRQSKNNKSITLKNVIDMDVTMKLEGYLVFEINGNTYELEAMDGGKESYFVIFADETTGVETYGAGRYIYVPRVDERGKTLIDFNKAYNPPCAFTDFATCPLPSAKNYLEISIQAGEKNYH